MSHDPAYRQLLTLIAARSQQWLRHRIEELPAPPVSGTAGGGDLAEIALAAHICTGLRGTPAPLQDFIRTRLPADLSAALTGTGRGAAPRRDDPPSPWARVDPAQAEAVLRAPLSEGDLSEDGIDLYARTLAACYRFGAERPRFASTRTYGEAFAQCLRLADWAQRNGRLRPLAQMCFCLCLIDPDHDVTPLLADVIASQRPDGSFPHRVGFGTAGQDAAALRPTLAALVALHMAVHRRWRSPRPTLPMAA